MPFVATVGFAAFPSRTTTNCISPMIFCPVRGKRIDFSYRISHCWTSSGNVTCKQSLTQQRAPSDLMPFKVSKRLSHAACYLVILPLSFSTCSMTTLLHPSRKSPSTCASTRLLPCGLLYARHASLDTHVRIGAAVCRLTAGRLDYIFRCHDNHLDFCNYQLNYQLYQKNDRIYAGALNAGTKVVIPQTLAWSA